MSALLSALLAAAVSAAPAPANNFSSVPDSAEGALVMDGAAGSALLTVFTPQLGAEPGPLAPGPLGQDLRQMVGVDLLSPLATAAAGLSATGPRALVLGDHAIGLSAPVEDEEKARKCMTAFLEQLGPTRQTRGAPLKAPLASGGGAQARAGWVVKTGAGLRLITASGKGSVTLAIQLGHVGRATEHALSFDPQIAAAQEQLQGPLLAWVRGRGTGGVTGLIKGAVVRLAWSSKALNAQGLLLPAPAKNEAQALAQLLAGDSPPVSACGAALLCVRAAPGPLLRELLEQGRGEAVGRALRTKAQREPVDQTLRALLSGATGGALLRVDSFDPRLLAQGSTRDLESIAVLAASSAATSTPLAGANEAGEVTLPGPPPACAGLAKGLEWLAWPCQPPGAEVVTTGGPRELWLRLDTPALWKALGPLSALDALRGQAVGTVVALKLLWGGLLAVSGPIEVAVRPPAAEGLPTALSGSLALDLQWPLPGKAAAQ